MFALFLLIWIILNGRFTAEVLIVGVALCVPLGAFCYRFMEYSLRSELRLIARIPFLIRYFVILLREIVKANFSVMHLILSGSLEPEPVLFSFSTKLRSKGAKVLLANSITLTPGTITVRQSGDRFVVHALDRENVAGTKESIFEEMLLELEQKEAPSDGKGGSR